MFVEFDTSKTEEELFAEYEYLIHYVIRNIPTGSVVDADDLYQEGAIALLKAIRRSKNGLKIKKARYIEIMISNRIRNYIMYQGNSLHASRRLQGNEYKKSKDAIENIVNRASTTPIYDVSENSLVLQANSIENDALTSLQLAEILKAVERLPKDKRIKMQAYFDCNMDVGEAAKRCGCTKRTIYRARAYLREKIRYMKIMESDMCDG